MEMVEGKAGPEKDASQYGFTPSKFVSLQTVLLPTSSSSRRKQRSAVLSWAMFFLLEPPRKCIETGLEVALMEGKARRCFLRVSSCCRDTSGAKSLPLIRHGAGICQPRVGRKIIFDNTVHGGRRTSCPLAAIARTPRRVHRLKKIAGMVSSWRQNHGRGHKLG